MSDTVLVVVASVISEGERMSGRGVISVIPRGLAVEQLLQLLQPHLAAVKASLNWLVSLHGRVGAACYHPNAAVLGLTAVLRCKYTRRLREENDARRQSKFKAKLYIESWRIVWNSATTWQNRRSSEDSLCNFDVVLWVRLRLYCLSNRVRLWFLANVNSCSCSLYVVVRPSVCHLSVCNVRAPYSADLNFRQYFCAI